MHDKLKQQHIGSGRLPNIKGHVSITLRDIDSGEVVARAEGDNMVTDAVKRIFESNLGGEMNYTELTPLYSTVFGGVLGFESSIDAKESNWLVPSDADNLLVAHAGQTTYASAEDDKRRGNPNSASSGEVTNGYKNVWTFDSTQANGTISTICLTHTDTGDMGTGMESTAFESGVPVSLPCTNLTTKDSICPIGMYDKNECFYMTTDGTTATIHIAPFVLTKFGVVDFPMTVDTDHKTTFSVELSTTPLACTYVSYDVDNRNLYVITINTSDRSVLYIDTINLTNQTISSVTNDYNVNFRTLLSTETVEGYSYLPLAYDDGYIYICGAASNSTMYKVSLTNAADITEISNPTSITFVSHWNVSNVSCQLYLGNGRVQGYGWIIDNDILYPNGDKIGESNQLAATRQLIQTEASPVFWVDNGVSSQTDRQGVPPGLALNKFYLATIYNLDSALTKTSSQTMTIEYTITEAD